MTTRCFFVSDLHGCRQRYRKLFSLIKVERPDGVFLGGDLGPGGRFAGAGDVDFYPGYFLPAWEELRCQIGRAYPQVFLILGNDDPRVDETDLFIGDKAGLWHWMHQNQLAFGHHHVLGYSCIPPSPFRLKDWERYDVSRYVDPGCSAPSDGFLTVPVTEYELQYGTIDKDLERMRSGKDGGDPVPMERSIWLFHAPPHKTDLDRAGLDGQMIDHVPLDIHIGSIAVRQFIEKWHPPVTLHGHVHEAPRLTGTWRTKLGKTHAFTAAHDGPELALVRFDPDNPAAATRDLL